MEKRDLHCEERDGVHCYERSGDDGERCGTTHNYEWVDVLLIATIPVAAQ